MKRANSSRKRSRRSAAESAIFYLKEVFENNLFVDEKLSNSAASQIKAISKRHSIPLDSITNDLICRGCLNILTPGSNSRIRIVNRMLRVTCIKCGKIRRKPLFRT